MGRCSKKALIEWLTAVMGAERDEEDTVFFNQNELSNDYDIRVCRTALQTPSRRLSLVH